MTDQSTIVLNRLKGIQSEINRTQIMLEQKHETRKKFIVDCLNNDITVKQIAGILDISLARVYKIMEEINGR